MKITIEHECARQVTINGRLLEVDLEQGIILNFSLQMQRLSNWCWAAIASSLGQFYSTNELTQEQIVSQLLEFPLHVLQGEVDDNHCSNQQLTLDQSLMLVNCYSHWSLGKPTLERLLLELSQDRVICVRIEWFSGGAHYLVVKGVNPQDTLLYIEDSLYGQSTCIYADFPNTYNNGGVWTDTFWVNPEQS